jgi:hypothetical protein
MTARVPRTPKVIAFDVNSIWRQRYELSKPLQDLHIDVTLPSETHLKPHERLYIVQKQELLITCYKAKYIHKRKTNFLFREDVT